MRMAQGSKWLFLVAAIGVPLALLAGCSSRNPEVRKQKYLESGKRYLDKGQYREAEIQFQNAIQNDARFAEAHYLLALAATKLGDGRTAVQELSKTIEIEPEHYKAHLDLANLLVLAGQFNDAKVHLDLLAEKEPDNPEVYLARANYYAATNNIAAALADLHTAIQKDKNHSDSYLSLGLLQARGQQWDAAEASFKTAIELNPKSTNAMTLLGNLYQTRGRFPEAEQSYRQAISSAPDDPNLRISLAGLYMAENKPGQAEEFLRQSKKDFPNNSEGYRLLGNFYYGNTQFDKAATEYASLYQEHPKDLVVKKNYIQVLIDLRRLDEARKLNDEVIKAKPDDSDARVYKAEIDIQSGKARDAVTTLQAVLKTDPENAGVAHYHLGLAYDQLGEASKAEGEWRAALQQRPDLVEAHRALAGVAIHRGDASGLAQEADQIIALQPAAPDGYLLRGVAEIDRKHYPVANEYLMRSLEKEPHNPAAYVQLGNLGMAQNQFAEAQKAYQQALDQDPNSMDALAGVLNVDLVQKQPDKAIGTARAQLSKYPKNVGFHIMLGQLLMEQKKDLPGAEAEFKQASDLDKTSIAAILGLGGVQSEHGATDEALQTYLDAIKNNPKAVDLYFRAGQIYESKQDWDRAKQQYQKVLEIEPDNAATLNQLAYLMLEQGGNVDVAFAMAQTARQKLPDNPNTADTLGWAFYHKQVYKSAITLFKEAATKDPGNVHFNYHLGLAYAKNGQVALAKQQLERLVKIKPNSQEVDELRRAMAEAEAKARG